MNASCQDSVSPVTWITPFYSFLFTLCNGCVEGRSFGPFPFHFTPKNGFLHKDTEIFKACTMFMCILFLGAICAATMNPLIQRKGLNILKIIWIQALIGQTSEKVLEPIACRLLLSLPSILPRTLKLGKWRQPPL